MQVNYGKIPKEMTAYKQWVVWKAESRGEGKTTKIPYDVKTGRLASVTNPETWASFDEVVASVSSYSGIGFVLTDNDPYTFIDLDDTKGDAKAFAEQQRIYRIFNSYSELSPSGKGLHIITKGSVPSGKRKGFVELYSNERFMTMTGCTQNNEPIKNCGHLLTTLWEEMGGKEVVFTDYEDEAEKDSDQEIIRRALSAANGYKVQQLVSGNWQQYYKSQSEADFALIDIIAFYTKNRAQISRLFRQSELGKRDKAQSPRYVGGMIRKAFDRKIPPITMIGLDEMFAKKAPEIQQVLQNDRGTPDLTEEQVTDIKEQAPMMLVKSLWEPRPIDWPPGMTGEIAKYIYASSIRPVKEVSICAAIAIMAAACGRAYNISNTGLNLYILILALTGTGKEGLSGGISRFIGHVRKRAEAVDSIRGPAEIASGQALIKYIAAGNHSFVSVIGEFGIRMQQLAEEKPSPHDSSLKRALLDLFVKSGCNDVLAPSIYADKLNNTAVVRAPCVSIVAESVPDSFYASLNTGMITSGLLPRMMIIEYKGDRPEFNENHANVVPDGKLIDDFVKMLKSSFSLQQAGTVCQIGYKPEAHAFLRNIDKVIDDAIRSTRETTLRELWTRSHLKTLRLAGILAVGVNSEDPTVTMECAEWAYNLEAIATGLLSQKFNNGEIGKSGDEVTQGKTVLRICAEYLTSPYENVKNYRVPAAIHEAKIIPMNYIQSRLATNKAFPRNNFAESIRRTLQGLIDCGDLLEVPRFEMQKAFDKGGRAFKIGAPDRLLDFLRS